MREIKFRAWDKDKNKMFVNGQLASWRLDIITANNNLVIMQFTGLLDKNGVEIYEGDIVIGEPPRYVNKNIGVVSYYGCAFHWEGKKSNREKWFDTITSDFEKADIEVIGNIHQNPELLEAKWPSH